MEQDSSSGLMNTQIETLVNNKLYFKSGFNNLSIKEIKVDNLNCNISLNISGGMKEIDLGNCLENLTTSTPEVVVFTDKEVFSKKVYVKDVKSNNNNNNILYHSCLEILNNGASHGDGLYNISYNSSTIEVYCDMTTDGGGWTGIIPNENTTLDYLAQFGDVSEITSTFYSNSSLGIGWGTNDNLIDNSYSRNFYFNFTYNEIFIVFSGYYNNPSGGLGYLRIFINDNFKALSFCDAWAGDIFGQYLYINETEVYYLALINEINREEFIQVPTQTNFIKVSMKGYTSSYPYTKRYIKKLYLR